MFSGVEGGLDRNSKDARIQEMMFHGASQKRAIQSVDKELEKERNDLQSFEEFDRTLEETEKELEAAIQAIKNLPNYPEIKATFEKRVSKSGPELEKTVSGKKAVVTRRLIEAYRKGNRDGLQQIFDHIPEEAVRERNEALKAVGIEIPADKDGVDAEVKKMYEEGMLLESLVGGYPGSATRDYPFSDETIGNHKPLGGHSTERSVWGSVPSSTRSLLEIIGNDDLERRLNRLSEFITVEQNKVRRDIVLSPKYREVVENYKKSEAAKKNNLRPLVDLAHEMEIERKDQIIPIGTRLEKLYRLKDHFFLSIAGE